MSISKRNVLTLLFLLIIYGWFLLSQALSPKPSLLKITPADNDTVLFIQPESGKTPIINAIDSAQKEVLVEVYLLSDKDIISSLENAKKRGVVVNIMTEQHPFGGGNLNNTSSKSLIQNGVSFKWTNPSFSLTHEKSIVIDNKEAFILSQNLTTSSFLKNREYNILDTNLTDVKEVRDIFISDWERKNYDPPDSSSLIVCPINCRNGITTIINLGKASIDIEIEDINDPKIVEELVGISKKIKIRLIAPTISQINSNLESLNNLKKGGVEIKTLSSPYIHAKLIIVDKKTAYLGSVNLSTQSMDQNRELGIILINPQNISLLSKTFEKDWEKALAF